MNQELEHMGKRIVPYIDKETLQANVRRIAEQISIDYKGQKPILIGVLNGAFIFMADLIRYLDKDLKIEIDFIKLTSYEGQQSTGIVKALSGIKSDIKDRSVIIVEDIVETGITINNTIDELKKFQPKEIRLASCFLKKGKLKHLNVGKQKVPVKIDYLGLEIDDYFIVGYGLDWSEYGRGLDQLYKVE
ncbi:hypothetical protein pb186bvf_012580 [Paramecium bursaria]